MKHLVFLLEEESAKELINILLPRIYPEISFRCISFEGKTDLEKNIPIKLKGYKVPNTHFIILRDSDSGDCKVIKQRLRNICISAFKPDTLIRIACKELESWYFGDLSSVEKALGLNNLLQYKNKKQFRIPDEIINPKVELKKLTKYCYQQISSSRKIGEFLDFENNTSHSFNVFVDGIKKVVD